MGLNHYDLTLVLSSFVYSLSVYWPLTTLSKLSWALGILVNKTGKRKILSIHSSIYRKSQPNLYYTHASKPLRRVFREKQAIMVPVLPGTSTVLSSMKKFYYPVL